MVMQLFESTVFSHCLNCSMLAARLHKGRPLLRCVTEDMYLQHFLLDIKLLLYTSATVYENFLFCTSR